MDQPVAPFEVAQDEGQLRNRMSGQSEGQGSFARMSAARLSTARLDPDLEVLEAYTTFSQHVKETLTPFRVILVVLCMLLSGLGVTLMSGERFRYLVEVHDIRSYNACEFYCNQARDENFTVAAWPSYSHPLCQDKNGNSLILFKECHGNDKSDCRILNHDDPSEPDNEIVTTQCIIPLVPTIWMPYVTVSIFACSIALVIQGLPPEVLLLGTAAFLAVVGVLTPEEVVKGFSSGGVLSLAVLFPISDAMTETGLLESVVGMMLGEPKTLSAALLRMMFPVALVSAFLSNTATVSMMIPIVTSWAKRLRVHPGKMLMPLSFAAQLGGCLTLLGGSQCLVAKASIPAAIYSMGFFDLLPIGLLNLIGTSLIITVAAGTGLLISSEAAEQETGTSATGSDVYTVIVVIRDISSGKLQGKTLAESGLDRLDGVFQVRLHRPSTATEPAVGGNHVLQAYDKLQVECNALGVVSLRNHPGLTLGNQEDADKLGSHRRRRSLYECSVRANSPLLRETSDSHDLYRVLCQRPQLLRDSIGACLISVKAPTGEMQCCVRSGSVLLLEADFVVMNKLSADWANTFSVIHQVPGSTPPRRDHQADKVRNFITCSGMVILIGLVTFDLIQLHIGGILFILVLLFIKALTPAQLFESIKPKVLLTIIGALALGTALEKVGVVNVVAELMTCAHGLVAITSVIYFLSVFLSMFINNSATIAILAPMLVEVAKVDPDLHIELLVWTLVYGAGSCFTTPLGYQTNLMVMPDGQYAFGDFIRFGSLIQLSHMAFTVAITYFLSSILF